MTSAVTEKSLSDGHGLDDARYFQIATIVSFTRTILLRNFVSQERQYLLNQFGCVEFYVDPVHSNDLNMQGR